MKIGDKVKMTKYGFEYYHNIDECFQAYKIGDGINVINCKSMLCSVLAIQGVGEIKDLNEDNYKIRWKYSKNGMYFYYTHWYSKKDIRKLTLLENIYGFITTGNFFLYRNLRS